MFSTIAIQLLSAGSLFARISTFPIIVAVAHAVYLIGVLL